MEGRGVGREEGGRRKGGREGGRRKGGIEEGRKGERRKKGGRVGIEREEWQRNTLHECTIVMVTQSPGSSRS